MSFEIFLATAPGLEDALYEEVRNKGFKKAKPIKGGVSVEGGWPDVWRANLWVRGASRVLARIGRFKVLHLSQLEMQARQIAWADMFGSDLSFRVEASCVKSRIYHSDAAAQRVELAISETLGALSSRDADVTVMVRIEHDICTISLDTSGDLLHKRGFKAQVNKAPMRENMAALFLQECGYKGGEAVFDPMCGSGTFVIEAAEIAARYNPGRGRHFAFEKLKTFDRALWDQMRSVRRAALPDIQVYGSDRDDGAVQMSIENAARAGVAQFTAFKKQPVRDMTPPSADGGLVIMNPPYGTRIGDKQKLMPLYQTLGQVLQARFSGWRAAIITSDAKLAHATGLPFLKTAKPVQHGGIRITLYQTQILP